MPDIEGLRPEDLEIVIPIFISSGRDYVSHFRELLEKAGTNELAADEREAWHRMIHSLKGASLQLGFMHIGDLAKAIEGIVKVVHQQGLVLSPEALGLLARAADQLGAHLDDLEASRSPAQPLEDLLTPLHQLRNELFQSESDAEAAG